MTLDNLQIEKVARNVSFQWPGVIESDDLEQEIWLHILERPGTQRDLNGMDRLSQYRTLSKIAHRIASQQRTDEEYATGNFRYSVKEVKQLLENGALSENAVELQSAWSAEEFLPSGGSHEDPTFAQVSVRLDFDNALGRLEGENPSYYELLTRKYLHWDKGEFSSSERDKLSRGLSRLTALMNKSHKRQHVGEGRPHKSLGDGPGTREVVSINRARNSSSSDWDGEDESEWS